MVVNKEIGARGPVVQSWGVSVVQVGGGRVSSGRNTEKQLVSSSHFRAGVSTLSLWSVLTICPDAPALPDPGDQMPPPSNHSHLLEKPLNAVVEYLLNVFINVFLLIIPQNL